MIKTSDGGRNWLTKISGTTNHLWGVSFNDRNNGTVVGDNGTILRTTDCGNTWQLQESGYFQRIIDVSYADSNYGIAACELGAIIKNNGWWKELVSINL